MEENRVIFERERLKNKEDFRGSIEILQPGIYFFEFDNSYSWLTSKYVTCRVQVLSCMDINYEQENPYVANMRGRAATKPDKLLNLRQVQKMERPPVMDLKNDISCVVSLPEHNCYRLTIKGLVKDDYEYELETENKEKVVQKLVEKVKRYMGERVVNRVQFVVGLATVQTVEQFER